MRFIGGCSRLPSDRFPFILRTTEGEGFFVCKAGALERRPACGIGNERYAMQRTRLQRALTSVLACLGFAPAACLAGQDDSGVILPSIDSAAQVIAAQAGARESKIWDTDFTINPAELGWRTHGDSTLFNWNPTASQLEVAWDSSRPNSYFFRPLGDILTRHEDFSVRFDLRLDQVEAGINPDKPFAFELALGWLNMAQATADTFQRGSGTETYNVVEFAYFPDTGFGATLWPTAIGSNGMFNYNGPSDYAVRELVPGTPYHVEMAYSALSQTIELRVRESDGTLIASLSTALHPSFTDFRVDAFAIASYSDAGAQGSLLAHGIIDRLQIELPAPPVRGLQGAFRDERWEVRFNGRAGWTYTLEKCVSWDQWEAAPSDQQREGDLVVLREAASASPAAFYRIRAEHP